VVRTQIQLTEEQATALKALAAERGASVAELVRESVDAFIRATKGLSWEERRRRALNLPSFRSGVTDLARRHDDYFVESIVDPVGQ
jgi:predicted DNA-binding protein